MTLNTQSLDPLIAQGGDNLPWINIDFFCSGAAVKNQVNWVYNQNVASFKGVPFAVIQDNRSGGRRIHVHEYPARETWDNEDMGRLRQQIDVSAFVYGDKCESWAETLFAYCTDPQIGVLTLPFRPAFRARCLTVETNYNAEAMGRLDFQMRFTIEPFAAKALQQAFPITSPTEASGKVSQAADLVKQVARDQFDPEFTGDQAHVGRTDAATMMRRGSNNLRNAAKASRLTSKSSSNVDFYAKHIDTMANELADTQRTISNTLTNTAGVNSQRKSKLPSNYTSWHLTNLALRASSNQIIPAIGNKDEGFGGYLEKAFKELIQGAPNPGDLGQALYNMSIIKPAILVKTMAATQAASVNAQYYLAGVVAAFIRRMAIAEICLAGIKVSPERQPDASLSRNRLIANLDNEIAAAAYSVPMYTALRSLRTAITDFTSYYSQAGKATDPVSVVWSNQPLAGVVANVYPREKITNRDEQIMRLNNVRHPLFPTDQLSALK